MRRNSVRYTDAEIELAKQLFARAQASGTLKPHRGLAAIALSNGNPFPRTLPIATIPVTRD